MRAVEVTNFSLRRIYRRRFSRRWLAVVVLPIAIIALWVGHLLLTDNFHVIVEGEAYRAGQMSSNRLARCLERYGIRSVINLRGEQGEVAWYRDELRVTHALGVVHFDLPLSARKSVSPRKANQLVALLQEAPKPVLIHCDGGADRAAFAAALYEARIAKQPVPTAERQFSKWYGYLPFLWKQKAQLRESFRVYMEDFSTAGRAKITSEGTGAVANLQSERIPRTHE